MSLPFNLLLLLRCVSAFPHPTLEGLCPLATSAGAWQKWGSLLLPWACMCHLASITVPWTVTGTGGQRHADELSDSKEQPGAFSYFDSSGKTLAVKETWQLSLLKRWVSDDQCFSPTPTLD